MSLVTDIASISYAVNNYHRSLGGDGSRWYLDGGSEQARAEYLAWQVPGVHAKVGKVEGLEAIVSGSDTTLNGFLVEHGIKPVFNRFTNPNHIGIAAAADFTLRWPEDAKFVCINVVTGPTHRTVHYQGFWIPPTGVNFYHVEGFGRKTLLCINTRTGHKLWLMSSRRPHTAVMLNKFVRTLVTSTHIESEYGPTGVLIPRFELKAQLDLNWLTGSRMYENGGVCCYVGKAVQSIHVHCNGSHDHPSAFDLASAITGLERPMVVDHSFLGCITAPFYDQLVLTSFYCEPINWKTCIPSGQ